MTIDVASTPALEPKVGALAHVIVWACTAYSGALVSWLVEWPHFGIPLIHGFNPIGKTILKPGVLLHTITTKKLWLTLAS